jgi:hypothetical protein
MGNGMHTMPNHCDPGARSPPRNPWGLRPRAVAGPFDFLRHAGLPSPTPTTTLTCRPSESPASAKDQGGQHHDDAVPVGSLHNGWSHGPPGAALSRLQGTAFGLRRDPLLWHALFKLQTTCPRGLQAPSHHSPVFRIQRGRHSRNHWHEGPSHWVRQRTRNAGASSGLARAL